MILVVEITEEEIALETAKVFGHDTSASWSPIPEYNLLYLKAQQQYFNDMLSARGHVFLNEVYDALGIPRTLLGAILGWDKEQAIDFGVDPSVVDDDISLSFNPNHTLVDLF